MKRNVFLGSVALFGAVALAACGGGGGGEAPATEETEAATEETAETEEAAEGASFADLTGDAAAGEKVFAVCTTCHAVAEGENKVGPSLYGIVGREAGTVEGFAYSDANKNSGITWSTEILYDYLEDPQGYMKGTKMVFPGVKDAQDRANLVAYLETLGG